MTLLNFCSCASSFFWFQWVHAALSVHSREAMFHEAASPGSLPFDVHLKARCKNVFPQARCLPLCSVSVYPHPRSLSYVFYGYSRCVAYTNRTLIRPDFTSTLNNHVSLTYHGAHRPVLSEHCQGCPSSLPSLSLPPLLPLLSLLYGGRTASPRPSRTCRNPSWPLFIHISETKRQLLWRKPSMISE